MKNERKNIHLPLKFHFQNRVREVPDEFKFFARSSAEHNKFKTLTLTHSKYSKSKEKIPSMQNKYMRAKSKESSKSPAINRIVQKKRDSTSKTTANTIRNSSTNTNLNTKRSNSANVNKVTKRNNSENVNRNIKRNTKPKEDKNLTTTRNSDFNCTTNTLSSRKLDRSIQYQSPSFKTGNKKKNKPEINNFTGGKTTDRFYHSKTPLCTNSLTNSKKQKTSTPNILTRKDSKSSNKSKSKQKKNLTKVSSAKPVRGKYLQKFRNPQKMTNKGSVGSKTNTNLNTNLVNKKVLLNSKKKSNVKQKKITQISFDSNLSQEHNLKSMRNGPLNNVALVNITGSSIASASNTLSVKNLLVTKKILKMGYLTETGYIGPKTEKINQDNYFIEDLSMIENGLHFIGVCDGHGKYGHLVSEFVKNTLPKVFFNEIKSNRNKFSSFVNNLSMSSINSKTPIGISEGKVPQLYKLLDDCFIFTNSKLTNNVNIDSSFSGTTCSSIILTQDVLLSANAGDSRVIKVRYNKSNRKWSCIQLSRDHKASEQDEANRIINFGGRVERFMNEEGDFIGPERVWLKDQKIPGLAMTRSFGDQIAAQVGVICEPEINEYWWDEEDKAIIIASDGLWQFLTNEEVVSIAKGYLEAENCQSACYALYKISKKRWLERDGTVDDITIIVILLT
ncbi:MAG: protein phosphatase 2C domain-containing protein [archaeon]|nr:protein phosphatase 2C domain-containing protein [archaeon]